MGVRDWLWCPWAGGDEEGPALQGLRQQSGNLFSLTLVLCCVGTLHWTRISLHHSLLCSCGSSQSLRYSSEACTLRAVDRAGEMDTSARDWSLGYA